MRFKSHFPPVSFESTITGKKYVICSSTGDGWVEVNRHYSWNELEKLWDKVEFKKDSKVILTVPIQKQKQTYKVEGSKGNKYTVVNDDGFWSCTCPAHGFGRGKDCKHIISIKTKK